MSLDKLVILELQKKALDKGVDLNDPEQFKAFAENLTRVQAMIEGMVIQAVASYQCQNCGKPKEGCTSCDEKRKAQNEAIREAFKEITTMTTGVDQSMPVVARPLSPEEFEAFKASQSQPISYLDNETKPKFVNDDEHY